MWFSQLLSDLEWSSRTSCHGQFSTIKQIIIDTILVLYVSKGQQTYKFYFPIHKKTIHNTIQYNLQGRNILEVSKIKMLSPYLIDELLKCGVVLSNNDSKHDLALTTIRIFTKAVCVFLVGQLLYMWSCMSFCLSIIVLSIRFLGQNKYSANSFL